MNGAGKSTLFKGGGCARPSKAAHIQWPAAWAGRAATRPVAYAPEEAWIGTPV